MDNSKLFESMRESLMQIGARIDGYMLAFKQKDFFTFSDIDERRKLYKHEYLAFVCDFNSLYDSLNDHIFSVSSLLLKSDREMDEENTVIFKDIFEKHRLLEKELAIFTSATETELSRTSPSVSVLLDSANRLLVSVKNLSSSLPL